MVELDNGKLLRLNYIASNGLSTYTGRKISHRPRHRFQGRNVDGQDPATTWKRIRKMVKPCAAKIVRSSFSGQTPLRADDECIGAQGVPLTAGRSLAVDKRVHVYGTPIWIDAQLPIESEKPETKFRRPPFRAGHGFGDRRTGTCRYIFRARRGDQSHCGPHQAKWAIRHAGAAERPVNNPVVAGAKNIPLPKPRPGLIVTAAARTSTPAAMNHPSTRRKPRR